MRPHPPALIALALFPLFAGCARLPLLSPTGARYAAVQRSCLGKGTDVPEAYRGECIERACEQEDSGRIACAWRGGDDEHNREVLRLLRAAEEKDAGRREADEQAQRRACAEGRGEACKGWYDRALEEWTPSEAPSLGVLERRRVAPPPPGVLAAICGMPAWRCRFHDEPTEEKSDVDRIILKKSGALAHEISRRGVLRLTDIEPAAAPTGGSGTAPGSR
jgi:hypothetical protein